MYAAARTLTFSLSLPFPEGALAQWDVILLLITAKLAKFLMRTHM